MLFCLQDIEARMHAKHGKDAAAYKSEYYQLYSLLAVEPEHGSDELRRALLSGEMSAQVFVDRARDLQEGVNE